MNRDLVQGNWKQFKGRVTVPWNNLSDDGRQVFDGERVELKGRLRGSCGLATDQAGQRIKVFAHVTKDYHYRLKRPW